MTENGAFKYYLLYVYNYYAARTARDGSVLLNTYMKYTVRQKNSIFYATPSTYTPMVIPGQRVQR